MAKNIKIKGPDGEPMLVRVTDEIAKTEVEAGRATYTSKGRFKRAQKAKHRDKILYPQTGYNREMRKKYGDFGVGVDPNKIKEAIKQAESDGAHNKD